LILTGWLTWMKYFLLRPLLFLVNRDDKEFQHQGGFFLANMMEVNQASLLD
jgi:hypothetical protein